MRRPVDWYNANAETVAEQYESLNPSELHAWMADLMPEVPANALDLGAGSGRDAAWLADKGFEVVAVEPSHKLRCIAQRIHPTSAVHWLSDGLPDLKQTIRTGASFDLILASAVWMHVRPPDRQRAFRKLVNLLNPGGLIAFSVRAGPSAPERHMYRVGEGEFEWLARGHGAYVERTRHEDDQMGRPDVRWMHPAVRLPDEGTGALPLLRHIILNDDKSATYKLGLLRSLCRIADGMAGLAVRPDDEQVIVPLGLVALTWIRLYKPLLEIDCPQSPANVRYGDRLAFAKAPFTRLRSHGVSSLDLRVGMRFDGAAVDLHYALRDAANTIRNMPAKHLRYQDGKPVFAVLRKTAVRPSGPVMVDSTYLWSFGEMSIPWRIWQALQRYSVWVEPAIIEEWARLMQNYATRQGRVLHREQFAPAMTWNDPTRDVSLPKGRAEVLLDGGRLHCVWSGRALSTRNLDVDHCLPWSAWPCSDLWNLMPAHRNVNQKEKRAQLPSASLMRSCQDRIMTWWEAAYGSEGEGLSRRFSIEVGSSLAGVGRSKPSLDTVFEAVLLQRARLRQNQRVPEWPGGKYARQQ